MLKDHKQENLLASQKVQVSSQTQEPHIMGRILKCMKNICAKFSIVAHLMSENNEFQQTVWLLKKLSAL